MNESSSLLSFDAQLLVHGGTAVRQIVPEETLGQHVQATASTWLSKGAVRFLVRRHAEVEDVEDGLSVRECEVLTLAASALTNRQIAERLAIAEATVKRHLTHIFRKLNVQSRMEAVHVARIRGLAP